MGTRRSRRYHLLINDGDGFGAYTRRWPNTKRQLAPGIRTEERLHHRTKSATGSGGCYFCSQGVGPRRNFACDGFGQADSKCEGSSGESRPKIAPAIKTTNAHTSLRSAPDRLAQ